MKLIGLVHIYQLRYLNTVVMLFITVQTLKEIDVRTQNNLEYLTGLGVSIWIAILSYSIFSFFMFFYLRFLDPSFMQFLIEHAPFGRYLNPLNASSWITIEGTGIQLVFTIVIMEYFKWMQYKLKSKKDFSK